MNKFIIISIFLLLDISIAKSQATFEKTFGTTYNESIFDISISTNKSTIVCGKSNLNLYLTKIDSIGQKIWSKTYSITNPYCGDILNTDDGGLILNGFGGIGSSSNVSFILKLDSLGNIVWSNVYSNIYLWNLKQIIGKGYIGIGQTNFQEIGIILKFDSLGNIVWKKTYSPLTSDRFKGRDILQSKLDSGFVVTGIYLPSPGTNNPSMLSRFDKNGQHLWSKIMPTLINDNLPNKLFEKPDGKIQFKCNSSILEFDANGNNGKRFLFNPYGLNISNWQPSIFSDKGYLLTGQINQNTTNQNIDIYVAKLDSLKNFVWCNSFGGAKADYDPVIKQSNDKKLIIGATTENFTNKPNDVYLLKTDSTGTTCNSKLLATYSTSMTSISTTTISVQMDSVYFVYHYPLSQINSTTLLSDSVENACGCIAPTTNFSITSFGYIQDYSKWGEKWYWDFSDGIQDSIHIEPVRNYSDGTTYTVCLTVKNSCGNSTTCNTFIYNYVPLTLQDLSKESVFIITPNPVKNILTIKSTKDYIINEVNIFDVTGKTLSFLYENKSIDISNLNSGIYFIKIKTDQGEFSQKFIKE